MFFDNLKNNYDKLSISEQQAIDYLMKQDNIEHTTLKEIKQAVLISSSTVIRACKKLGYNTFIDLKYDLKMSKELAKNNGCILNPGHGKIPAPDFNFYIQKDKYPI